MGLSPRVRGNPRPLPVPPHIPRSIPACAGEPPDYDGGPGLPRVYPRVCGGTSTTPSHTVDSTGLSPRVRGNRVPRDRGRRGARSIPACAGEPLHTYAGGDTDGVYPRVCGGTAIQTRGGIGMEGLSPRVRGNPKKWYWICPIVRSIPACAGEPPRESCGRTRRRVYPRVCGGTSCLSRARLE